MHKGCFLKEHWLRLVLFLVLSVSGGTTCGQQLKSTLFPAMPRHLSFQPTLLQGKLPESSGLSITTSQIHILPKLFLRNNKAYTQLNFTYDGNTQEQLTLRQQGDTIWLALDTQVVQWDTTANAQKLARIQEQIRQLREAYSNNSAGWFSEVPTSIEENIFLRFNAAVGARWLCYRHVQGHFEFYWVQLEKIISRKKKEPLYLFSVLFSGGGSHMSKLRKLAVSRQHGIEGTVWYDYACWEPYDCSDLMIGYGSWK